MEGYLYTPKEDEIVNGILDENEILHDEAERLLKEKNVCATKKYEVEVALTEARTVVESLQEQVTKLKKRTLYWVGGAAVVTFLLDQLIRLIVRLYAI